MSFEPFVNDVQSMVIEDLTIENNGERLSLYGSLNITLDQDGMRKTEELFVLISNTLKHLQELDKANLLPNKIEVKETQEVRNPFLDY